MLVVSVLVLVLSILLLLLTLLPILLVDESVPSADGFELVVPLIVSSDVDAAVEES